MLAGLAFLLVPSLALAQVSVSVELGADVHPISPLIYGINFADENQLTLGNLTLTRWGGNSTTRYNWQQDVTNTAQDYYFENLPGCWGAPGNCVPPPADPRTTSGANGFLALAGQHQLHTLFTVPVMGLVAKPPRYAHPFDCGCPKTLVANQDAFDPYDPGCGNGHLGGVPVTCDGAAISQPFGAADAQAWAGYLVARFGASAGRRIYQLDNEPNLWSSTHHDAHPVPTTYDELWTKERDTAVALLAADPTAEISGPAEWGWSNYFCSGKDTATGGCGAGSPDRAAHGGTELVAWLLQQAKSYQDGHGTRILHWLDLHYYPQGGNGPDNVRSLWDPSYVDPSWIASTGISGGIVRLIPRMRDWVAQNYPGTRISLSEYAWFNDVNGPLGPVIYAEVLGVFGRERLDAATAWGGPARTDTAFAAFKLFRNYDGAGAGFGDTSVRATPAAGAGIAAFAATGAARLTVALTNETASTKTVAVQLAGGTVASTAQWWRTSSNAAITRQADVPVTGSVASVSLPPQSIGMLVVSLQGASGPDAGVPDAGSPPDGGSSQPDAGAPGGGGIALDDPLPAVSGSCSAGGGRGPAEFPLLIIIAALALAVRFRHTR